MIARFFKGLGALIVLVAVIAGIPAFLALVVGNPLPTVDQWHQIASFQPDYGNVIVLTKILPCIAWVAWALFAGPWLFELISRAGGRAPQRRVWLFRGQQRMAAVLVAAVFLMFAGTASLSIGAAPASAAPAQDAHAAVAQYLQEAPAAPVAQQAAPAPTPEAAAPQAEQHADLDYTVKPGDTLWGIAQQHLGNGQDYQEIADASEHIIQADGQHLSDPNLILPGWQLDIPGAGPVQPAPAAPADPEAPAPAPSTSSTSGSQAGSSQSSAADQAQQADAGAQQQAAATPQAEQQAPTAGNTGAGAQQHSGAHAGAQEPDSDVTGPGDFSVPLATAGGIAGFLAAGLLAALGLRRLQQRRRRQAGERIAMPEQEAADLELELRMVENPIGQEDIDNALRCLQVWAEDTGARLPELLAVRVDGEEIALYLTEPADLPAPFERAAVDGTAWVVRPGTAIAPSRDAVSPYPALTTLGVDAQGGHLLLDLEQIGSLNVVGDAEDIAIGVLNAMAVELASSPWSEGVRVTLVGLPIQLARDIDRYRIQHVDDVDALVRNLRADLEDRRAALDSYGATDVHDARAHASDDEGWAPHIVILAKAPTEELRDQLAELVALMPRLGIATVASGDSVAAGSTVLIHDRDEAEYRASGTAIPPLPFRPQILDGSELELVQALFATTQQDSHPADIVAPAEPVEIPADGLLPVDEALALEHAEPEAASVADEPEPAETEQEAAAEASADEQQPEPEIAAAGDDDADVEVAEEEEPAGDEEPAETAPAAEASATDAPESAKPAEAQITSNVPDWPAPVVRLLGPIDALNIADGNAMPGRGLELMAYLLLQTGPASGAQIMKAMWPDKYDPKNNNVRQLAKQLRAVLGNDPDGHLLLPEGRNNVGFTMHPAIRTDWDEFKELIGPDLSRTTNENLVAAIRLVRGEPFTGATKRRGWWGWRSALEEEMRAAVLDAADELASRALGRGDLEQARMAAHIAEAADPLNEAGWRLELKAALQAGDVEEFNRVVDELYARVGGADPNYELDETTQELVDTAQAKLTETR